MTDREKSMRRMEGTETWHRLLEWDLGSAASERLAGIILAHEGTRIDDTPVHKALREALANCLMNADFYESRGVVIKLENHRLTLENPGYIRVGKKQIRLGGVSDPRNKGLMKMFNLIDIGERAGSGVPDIFNVWNVEGFESPEIIEEFDPDRTKLILSFEKRKKQAIKTSDRNKR